MTTSGRPGAEDAGFAIAFRGPQVEVVLPALEEGDTPPNPAVILTTLRTTPLKSVDRQAIDKALEAQLTATEAVRAVVGEAPVPKGSVPPLVIVLSSDRLAAYAVPVELVVEEVEAVEAAGDAEASSVAPPLVTAEMVRHLLNEAGVTHGRLDEVTAGFVDGVALPDIVCVARGSRPVPGIDAVLEYHFNEHVEAAPTVREDGSVDHHAAIARRFVEEGAVLVTRSAPQPGTAGTDLAGKVTEPPPTKDLPLELIAGKNTDIVGDTLVSTSAGRPERTPAGIVDVLPVFEVLGDVDYSVGNIDFPGEVIVRGDVKSGFSITARGSVTVRGLVESASITAGGDVALTGVVGEHETYLKVGGNLTAAYLHTTEAHVTGTIEVTGEIMNSTLVAQLVRTNPKGRIVGGQITAETEIDTGTLGSREARATRVHVTSLEPTATVRARRVIYPGVLVLVGTARREIRDEMEPASFWDAEGAIVSLRADIDTTEAIAANAPAEDAEGTEDGETGEQAAAAA